jgi:hypothetical protein
MDRRWGVGGGWLLFDIFGGGWRRGGGADMAVQFNERAVSTCEATGSQNTRARRIKAREQDKRDNPQRSCGYPCVCCRNRWQFPSHCLIGTGLKYHWFKKTLNIKALIPLLKR